MLRDSVAVIDIGSYKLTALIGENGVNKNYSIRAISESIHDAFDGEINYVKLFNAIKEALEVVSTSAKARIDKVYIGVPGELLRVSCSSFHYYFNGKKRLKDRHLKEFFDGAQKLQYSQGDKIIARSPICLYQDGNVRMDKPLGQVTSSINGLVSFEFCNSEFIEKVTNYLKSLKIKNVIFIPMNLAEGRLLFDDEQKKSIQILVDVGYSSTYISIYSGEGVLFEKSIKIGGGYITAYLFDKMKVDFEIAEKLKRKINLSLSPMAEGYYEVLHNGNQYSFSAKDTNDIARGVIDELCEEIDKVLNMSKVKIPHDGVISLTGGGISYLRGSAEYLAKRIEMPVNNVCPSIAYMSKPDESSRLALLNYVLNEHIY